MKKGIRHCNTVEASNKLECISFFYHTEISVYSWIELREMNHKNSRAKERTGEGIG